MIFIKLRNHLLFALLLVVLALIWGCGSGGGSTASIIDNKNAMGTVIASGNGTFVIQGNAMANIAGIELNATYDSTSLGTPSVSQGSLIPDAMLVANTKTLGAIKIAIISVKSISGSGPIATVSFASHAGTGNFALTANMINTSGVNIGSWSSTANDF
jgi:hypothetical protein